MRLLKKYSEMPENKLFGGDDPIRLFLSDDKNKIPLKVHASMFVGSVQVDILKADNVHLIKILQV